MNNSRFSNPGNENKNKKHYLYTKCYKALDLKFRKIYDIKKLNKTKCIIAKKVVTKHVRRKKGKK